jgi:hypothetical protein
MIRTSPATGAVVGSVFGATVDGELVVDDAVGGAAVAVVVELAEWLLEHAASATIATVAVNEATRDRRITRS